jgi:broad specificity phosphatase PhoE
VSGYDDAPRTHPWSILVGHDGVFKVVLLTLFDLPLERFWMWSSELCGISVIEVRAGRPVVRAMNLTEHLAGIGEEALAAEEADARARLGAL